MTVSLSALPKGHEFAETKFELTPEWVAEYRGAVEDQTGDAVAVPPLGLATICLRELLGQTSLPEGAIHAGQELSFSISGEPAGVLVARARIASRGERQGWVLMSLEMMVDDEGGSTLVSGRATITFPADGGGGGPAG
jgi:hypothetical protein